MIARAPSLACGALLALALGCSVDDAAFEARVFECDTAARDPRCGSDTNGQPMTCFAASQLDGIPGPDNRLQEQQPLPH